MSYYYDLKFSITARVIQQAATPQGLGIPLALLANASSTYTTTPTLLADVTAIAAAETASDLTATEASELTAMLSQDRAPNGVWVVAYDDTDPGAAADAAIAAGYADGVLFLSSQADAQVANIGAWLGVSNRWARYVVFGQSANSDLVTSGKPSALEDAEQNSMFIVGHDTATEPLGAALCGRIAGYPLISGPAGIETRITGVALDGYTDAQQTFALANDVLLLLQDRPGGGAQQRLIKGGNSYGGQSGKAMLSIVYGVRRLLTALQNVVNAHAISGDALVAGAPGVAEVRGACQEVLADLADNGHLSPGVSGTGPSAQYLPDGYLLAVTASGSTINATITMRADQEALTVSLDVTGEITA